MNKIGSITLSILHVLLLAFVTTNISAQTTSTSQPVKQTVNGYFFNGSFRNSITKVLLHLEDDFVIGYDNEGGYKSFERKRKIHQNSISNPSKVASDPQMKIGGDYTHHYLDYYIEWGARTVYFNLNKSVAISSEKHYDIVSSHKPIIKTDAYYIDPTWNDVSYRTMVIKLQGDKIITYEDPLTKQYLFCNNSFHEMTSEEKNQMKLYDSQGRSYELYIGDCTHIGKVGKFIVYFRAPNNVNEVFPENDVDKRPMVKLDGHGNGNRDNRINLQDYLQTKLATDASNPNPLEDMVLSYIANSDGVISDIKVVKSPDNSLDKDVINTLDNISASRIEPALRDNKYVNMQGTLTVRVKRSLTIEQKFNICEKYFEDFFSNEERKEAIDYARQHLSNNTSEFPNMSLDNASKGVKKLAAFIDNNSKSIILQSSSYFSVAPTAMDLWNKIENDLYKFKKTNKANTDKSDVYIKDRNSIHYYLKDDNDRIYVDCLMNKLNDIIYNYIANKLAKDELDNGYYIPNDLKEVSNLYTKEHTDKEFEIIWSRNFTNIDIDTFANNSSFSNQINKWKQNFYYYNLGTLRNVVFSQDKQKMIGKFYAIGKWENKKMTQDYKHCENYRKYMFNNTKPYMLYPLQEDHSNYYILTRFSSFEYPSPWINHINCMTIHMD